MNKSEKLAILNSLEDQLIKLSPAPLVADRPTIEKAVEYMDSMTDTPETVNAAIAFRVFWNTLANNYYLIEKTEEQKEAEKYRIKVVKK
jgi:hypothetical protein